MVSWAETEANLWDAASRYHAEPFRSYHDLSHPREMAQVALDLGLSLTRAQVAAIAFHDAVNVAGAPNSVNEEASAAILLAYAEYLGLAADDAQQASRIILATDHRRGTDDPEAHLVLDLDLLRLARPYDEFIGHSRSLHREWRHIEPSERAFMRGRARFLGQFLRRDRIYRTAHFDEASARDNMVRFVRDWS